MNSFGNIVIAVIFIDLVYSLFGNADRQIKRFFWKKEIKADEKTKREFRLHHIIQDLTALTVLIAFRLTENVAIIAVGAPIFFTHTVMITLLFRKRV